MNPRLYSLIIAGIFMVICALSQTAGAAAAPFVASWFLAKGILDFAALLQRHP